MKQETIFIGQENFSLLFLLNGRRSLGINQRQRQPTDEPVG